MAASIPLTEVEFAALRKFDACTIANAIEKFRIRLRNAGFTDASFAAKDENGSEDQG